MYSKPHVIESNIPFEKSAQDIVRENEERYRIVKQLYKQQTNQPEPMELNAKSTSKTVKKKS